MSTEVVMELPTTLVIATDSTGHAAAVLGESIAERQRADSLTR
jgi:hypothetical protein